MPNDLETVFNAMIGVIENEIRRAWGCGMLCKLSVNTAASDVEDYVQERKAILMRELNRLYDEMKNEDDQP